jgi:RNA polymerase sigma-70 factor (ECF subfamily)
MGARDLEGRANEPRASSEPDSLASSLPGLEAGLARALPRIVAWGRLRFAGRPGFDLDDFVQETCLRALAAYSRFDARRGSFHGWLFGIAHRVMLQDVRRGRRAGSVARAQGDDTLARFADSITSVSRAAARDEGLARLVQAIDALPEEDRQLVLLRGIEERPFVEVAATLGIAVEAATKRWERLRTRLQALPEIARLLPE